MKNVSEETIPEKGTGSAIEESRLRGWLLSDDAEEFGRLVPLFQRKLLRLALHMLGNLSEAEQVVQEAFLRAYKSRFGFRGEAAVGTWLSRIVSHLCLDCMKQRRWRLFFSPLARREKAGREEEQKSELDRLGVEARQYETVWQKEIGSRLQKALEKLSPRQKSVFVLLYLEGLSVVEIGRILGMEPGTVKVQAHRARMQLRGLLADLAPEQSSRWAG